MASLDCLSFRRGGVCIVEWGSAAGKSTYYLVTEFETAFCRVPSVANAERVAVQISGLFGETAESD